MRGLSFSKVVFPWRFIISLVPPVYAKYALLNILNILIVLNILGLP